MMQTLQSPIAESLAPGLPSLVQRVGEDRGHGARRASRRGITLLELLIVITILALVTVGTIPLMLSGVDQRKAREAARLVTTYISAARNRATETGRLTGVMFVRNSSGIVAGGSSILLATVECPQLYAGDTLNSTVTVSGGQVTFGATDNYAANVHVGDIIRFGYQGRTYFLLGTGSQSAGQALTSNSSMLAATDGSTVVAPPMTNVTYQVTRQPTKSAITPLQLPEGVVIDLVASGYGLPASVSPPGYLAVDGNPIMITFNPTGAVDQTFYYGQLQGHMQSPLCLLIGKPDQIPLNATPASDANLFDGTSLWVAVTAQGRVITVENAINSAASASAAGARAFIYGSYGATTSLGGG
jgi:prepilin-type N-terminal cleavage/methylation domain-containing protein